MLYINIKSRKAIDLNTKDIAINLLENILEECHWCKDLRIRTQKYRKGKLIVKEMFTKFYYIQIKNLLSKDTLK